jgi:hypothetical protein
MYHHILLTNYTRESLAHRQIPFIKANPGSILMIIVRVYEVVSYDEPCNELTVIYYICTL